VIVETFEVSLVIDRVPSDAELVSVPDPQLEEAGVVAFETSDGNALVHLAHESESLPTAIGRGVRAVEQLGQLGLEVIGVASNDVVSLRDIAAHTGRTYESVRLIATGKRGPGGFPAPLSRGQWALYSWTEVSIWLAQHYGTEAVGSFDRQIAAADYLIRARRIIDDDTARGELAQLLAV
jgi:hypothetical protein